MSRLPPSNSGSAVASTSASTSAPLSRLPSRPSTSTSSGNLSVQPSSRLPTSTPSTNSPRLPQSNTTTSSNINSPVPDLKTLFKTFFQLYELQSHAYRASQTPSFEGISNDEELRGAERSWRTEEKRRWEAEQGRLDQSYKDLASKAELILQSAIGTVKSRESVAATPAAPSPDLMKVVEQRFQSLTTASDDTFKRFKTIISTHDQELRRRLSAESPEVLVLEERVKTLERLLAEKHEELEKTKREVAAEKKSVQDRFEALESKFSGQMADLERRLRESTPAKKDLESFGIFEESRNKEKERDNRLLQLEKITLNINGNITAIKNELETMKATTDALQTSVAASQKLSTEVRGLKSEVDNFATSIIRLSASVTPTPPPLAFPSPSSINHPLIPTTNVPIKSELDTTTGGTQQVSLSQLAAVQGDLVALKKLVGKAASDVDSLKTQTNAIRDGVRSTAAAVSAVAMKLDQELPPLRTQVSDAVNAIRAPIPSFSSVTPALASPAITDNTSAALSTLSSAHFAFVSKTATALDKLKTDVESLKSTPSSAVSDDISTALSTLSSSHFAFASQTTAAVETLTTSLESHKSSTEAGFTSHDAKILEESKMLRHSLEASIKKEGKLVLAATQEGFRVLKSELDGNAAVEAGHWQEVVEMRDTNKKIHGNLKPMMKFLHTFLPQIAHAVATINPPQPQEQLPTPEAS